MNAEKEKDSPELLTSTHNYYFLFTPKEFQPKPTSTSVLFVRYFAFTLILLFVAIFSTYWFLLQPFRTELAPSFKDYLHTPSAYFIALWFLLTSALLFFYIYQARIARDMAYVLNTQGSILASSLFQLESELRKELEKIREERKPTSDRPSLLQSSETESSTSMVIGADYSYPEPISPSQESKAPDIPWEKYDALLETYGPKG